MTPDDDNDAAAAAALTVVDVERLPQGDLTPVVGAWFWYTYEAPQSHRMKRGAPRDGHDFEDIEGVDPEKKRVLVVVDHVGTNYAKISAVGEENGDWRVHFDVWTQVCEPAPDADAHIAAQIAKYQTDTRLLIDDVKKLMRRLAVAPEAGPSQASSALALLSTAPDLDAFKKALVVAKDSELPHLYSELKSALQATTHWMAARNAPLSALVEMQEGATDAVKKQLGNIEIYAGIDEDIVTLREGTPAAYDAPIHLMQRRHYMDEESLAHYDVGGMDYRSIKEFDAWLARDDNFERLFPHPRTLVAFRIRRRNKERKSFSLADWFAIQEENRWDKTTFLYIRSGEQLFRASTQIDFDAKLFPDFDHHLIRGNQRLYSESHGRGALISEGDYEQRIREAKAFAEKKAAERAVERKKHAAKLWDYRAKRRALKGDKKARKALDKPYLTSDHEGGTEAYRRARDERRRFSQDDWTFFSPASVYYDDIAERVREELHAYNRILMLLQGILDRSMVFSPHPPWSLWNDASFDQAVRFVYDDSRALVPGPPPDFAAYFHRLAGEIVEGSVVLGQEDFWERLEAKKENARRHSRDYQMTHHRPYGNPGPGLLTIAGKINKKGEVLFTWERQRTGPVRWYVKTKRTLRCNLRVPRQRLFNVSAYKPGDFKVFFADPRTRAEYLQWAPYMLVAEEYYAGLRPLESDAGEEHIVAGGGYRIEREEAPEGETKEEEEERYEREEYASKRKAHFRNYGSPIRFARPPPLVTENDNEEDEDDDD